MTPQLNLEIKGKLTLERALLSPSFQSELDTSETTVLSRRGLGQREQRAQIVILYWFICMCIWWIPSCWLQARQQLVSQLWELFWSFPIKHDPLPLILFATRSVTVILSTTNRLLQLTVKSTPDRVEMGSHGITHWKSVNKRCLLYLLPITLSKKTPLLYIIHCYHSLSHIVRCCCLIVYCVTGCKNKYSSLKGIGNKLLLRACCDFLSLLLFQINNQILLGLPFHI